jgi:hypothetical protein
MQDIMVIVASDNKVNIVSTPPAFSALVMPSDAGTVSAMALLVVWR